jgi:hypothetical protein
MQSIMFLKSTEDGPVDRLINLDRLATAALDPDTGGTIVIVSGAQIKIGIKFKDFLAQVEKLIAENYRISNKSYAVWHNKRQQDAEKTMRSVLSDLVKS